IYTAAPGHGSSRVAATMGTLFGIPALVAPVIVAAALSAGAPLVIRAPVLTIGAASYGLALAWAGVRIAATTGASKMPELCQVAPARRVSSARQVLAAPAPCHSVGCGNPPGGARPQQYISTSVGAPAGRVRKQPGDHRRGKRGRRSPR